ncbi:MAG: hypothetical protein LBH44_01905 [Treponema sp.]|nr:hypothetical protein [Treponema sp.]
MNKNRMFDYPNDKRQPQNHRCVGKNVEKSLRVLAKYAQVREQSSRPERGLKTAASLEKIRSEHQLMANRFEYRSGKRQDLYRYHFRLIDAAMEMQNELQNGQIIKAIAENILNVYQDNLKQGAKDFRRCFGALHDEVYI